MIFDLRITQPGSLSSIVESILAITHAFIRGTEHLKDNLVPFQQPHVLRALNLMLRTWISQLTLLDYIWSRTTASTCAGKPPLIAYMEKFSVLVAELLHDIAPHSVPYYSGDLHEPPSEKQYGEILAFCRKGFEEGIRTNWSESKDTIWFGHHHARREVVLDLGSMGEERAKLVARIEELHAALGRICGDDQYHSEERRNIGNDVVV